jgi:ATP phosphoribosyltransferase regulatory subunit
VIDRAAQLFAAAAPSACAPLAALAEVADKIAARMPGVNLHFDLCELHGYHYHTGLVFAAYVPGQGEAVANGGRYDDIGRVFGRARPATGFSFDLKTLLGLLPAADAASRCGVFVDHALADAAWNEIQRLRDSGERVLLGLPGQQGSACCDRELRRAGDAWHIHTV